ncbi:MAG: radical SAM protein [Bryobacteraceae bacterium]
MLVGIAKMAAESPRLEAKRTVEYFELPARSIVNRVENLRFFRWAINPYRGCEFGCHYCYARYTHEFMELRETREFEDKIFAKGAVGPLLRRDLAKVPRGDVIAIGTATDPYQPAERRFGRTREILEVFAEDRGRTLSITTKSDLAARDIDVLRRIGERNVVSVTMTVTTVDTELARALEPRAPRPDLRLAALDQLARAGIAAGVFSAPVMPLINDSERQLEAVARAAKSAGATFWGANVLFLSSSAQKAFFPFLEERYPRLVKRYRDWFSRAMYLRGGYPEQIRARVAALRARVGLLPERIGHAPQAEEQLLLFPEPTEAAPTFPTATAERFRAPGLPRRVGTCA